MALTTKHTNVTPAGGAFAGTELTFQKTYYSDSAKTTETDPTTVAASLTQGGVTTTPTPTNPSTGVYKVIVSLVKGTNVLVWTATDASGNDLISKDVVFAH